MSQEEIKRRISKTEEESFLNSHLEIRHLLEGDRRQRRQWTFESIYQQVDAVLKKNPAIQTLDDYRQWRSTLAEEKSNYPSVDTIYRLKLLQLERVKCLFQQGQVGRPLKWTPERIWESLNQAYEASKQANHPFTPKYYRQWQSEQKGKTPSYSTINEVVGSFKEIRTELEVQDQRFKRGSNRPKRWTEEIVWNFLEKAMKDLKQEGLELTQQTFLQWREQQLQQNMTIPALSTIKSILGRGGFVVWRNQLKE